MHARPTSSAHSTPDARSTPSTSRSATSRATAARADGDIVVGTFRLDVTSDRWTWSDEVYLVHGFEPGQVVPSTQLLLSHAHPDDAPRLTEVLDEAQRDGSAFSHVYRALDAAGETRTVAIVGSGRRDDGAVRAVDGYVVDLTGSYRAAVDREATAAIAASSLSRATIEQAKGIVVAALGITDERAFDVLRQFSNDSNTPVRVVAARLVASLQLAPSGALLGDVRKHLAAIAPVSQGADEEAGGAAER